MDRLKFRVYFKGSDYAKAGYADLTRTDVIFSLRTDGQIVRDIIYECQMEEHKGESCHVPYTPDNNLYDIQFCTGMKDKNGKLIYEGDILKCYYIDSDTDKLEYDFMKAVFNEETCAFALVGLKTKNYEYFTDTEFISDEYEVIGNIYENQELLEG